MKTEYLYLWLAARGECRRFAAGTTEPASLPDLLADGWRPVRETPLGEGSVLILLEREVEGSFGFGFSKG